MDKEKILDLITRIFKALDSIAVSGYNNTKTLSNCMEALQQLADVLSACSIEAEQEEPVKSNKRNTGITPTNPNKPRPEQIREDGD